MKASYRWLSALVPGLSASPREVAERFTRAGIAVDGIDEYGAGTETLVPAAVRKIEPHPKRDKLRLVTVDRGDGVEQRVVCGAPNVPDPGFMVALAPVGATLSVLPWVSSADRLRSTKSFWRGRSIMMMASLRPGGTNPGNGCRSSLLRRLNSTSPPTARSPRNAMR